LTPHAVRWHALRSIHVRSAPNDRRAGSRRAVRVLAIDPGPTSSGFVEVDSGRVVRARSAIDLSELVDVIESFPGDVVAIERVQSYGIAGGSLLRTSEVVGRLWQTAHAAGLDVRLVYRREVLRALDVTGKGSRDVLVRQRLIEMNGGTRRAAVGVKADQGPLYGVAGHAWAALAVAVAVELGAGEAA